MRRRAPKSWPWLVGNFESGAVPVEGELPYIVLYNGDSVAHTFTLGGRAGPSNLQQPISLVLQTQVLTTLPTSVFGDLSIDSATDAVNYFYSEIPVGPIATGAAVVSNGGQLVLSLEETVGTDDSAIVYTTPVTSKAFILRFKVNGTAGQTFFFEIYNTINTGIIFDQTPNISIPASGQWIMSQGLWANSQCNPPYELVSGDVLYLTNLSVSDTINYSIEIVQEPL